jgi:hypothetical protein
MFEHLDDPYPPNPDDVRLRAVQARADRHQRKRHRLLVMAVIAAATALLVPTVVLASPDRNGGSKVSVPPPPRPSPTASTRVPQTTQESTTTPGQSGVRGVVVLGPTCPLEGIGQDCGTRSSEATVLVRGRSSGAITATVHAGQDGRFNVALRPGQYVVTAETPKAEYCDRLDVTVVRDQYANIAVRCDTGIR